MAIDKAVDSAKLDGIFRGICDVIREKEGTSGPIPVSEIASRIASIPTGLTTRQESGTFTTNKDGSFHVQLNAAPDAIYIYHPDAPNDYVAYMAGQTGRRAVMFGDQFGGLLEIWIGTQDNAFVGAINLYSWGFEKLDSAGIVLNYIAYRIQCGGQ